jgi:hypothetical protein
MHSVTKSGIPIATWRLPDQRDGDGIPQAAQPEYLSEVTANKFRSPPLWGLRFRYQLMHDGDAPGLRLRSSGTVGKPSEYAINTMP